MAKPDMGKLRTSLNASVDKYVKQQARNTISQNAERDPACEGYVRIPGPDACDFCVTMGAHDHFYRTRETAGGGAGHGSKDDRYHAYCNCQICLVFRRNGDLVCRDPETGGVMPYDGAAAVRRYQDAGRPTFAKNRAREAARRRADRAAGVRFSAGGKQARKAGANTGRKLAQAEYDAAVKLLSDVASVEELRDAAERIVANWPKDSEGLRHKGQWSELSKLVKAREKELKAMPAVSVEIDELVPCLRRMSDGHILDTVVSPVSGNELKGFNAKSGWYVNWHTGMEIVKETGQEIRKFKLAVEGSDEIQGLIAMTEPNQPGAYPKVLWAVANPKSQGNIVGADGKEFDGIGGHLFAIACDVSRRWGYEGEWIGQAANKRLLGHYIEKMGVEQLGNSLQFIVSDDAVDSLSEIYNFRWKNS